MRAFEAAARHRSFKKAADELCVTQAAISHQVKALEAELDRSLFHRGANGVTPTAEADKFGRELGEALDRIADATAALIGEVAQELRVSVAPSFATRWLLPRLEDFHASQTEVRIAPLISQDVVELASGEIDAALRYGRGGWPGLTARRLYEEELVAVAAPEHVETADPAQIDPELRLLGTALRREDWPRFFLATRLDGPASPNYLDFPTLGLAIDAAVSGLGAALVDRRLIVEDLKAGRLAVLGVGALRVDRGLYLVSPLNATPDARLDLFFAWLSAALDQPK